MATPQWRLSQSYDAKLPSPSCQDDIDNNIPVSWGWLSPNQLMTARLNDDVCDDRYDDDGTPMSFGGQKWDLFPTMSDNQDASPYAENAIGPFWSSMATQVHANVEEYDHQVNAHLYGTTLPRDIPHDCEAPSKSLAAQNTQGSCSTSLECSITSYLAPPPTVASCAPQVPDPMPVSTEKKMTRRPKQSKGNYRRKETDSSNQSKRPRMEEDSQPSFVDRSDGIRILLLPTRKPRSTPMLPKRKMHYKKDSSSKSDSDLPSQDTKVQLFKFTRGTKMKNGGHVQRSAIGGDLMQHLF